MKILFITTFLLFTNAFALQNNVIGSRGNAFSPIVSVSETPHLNTAPAVQYSEGYAANPFGVSNSTYEPKKTYTADSNTVTIVGAQNTKVVINGTEVSAPTDGSQIELNPNEFSSDLQAVNADIVAPVVAAPVVAPKPAVKPKVVPVKVASLGDVDVAPEKPPVAQVITNPLKINLADLKGSEPATTRNAGHATLACKNPSTPFECMACNCVNEAKASRYDDMLAVSLVVMTRKNLRAFPDTVCGVVKQRWQFSWFNTMATRKPVPKGNKCFKAADQALAFTGYFADHYHAAYVNPKWARNMRNKKVIKIGTHTYYMNSRVPREATPAGSTVEV